MELELKHLAPYLPYGLKCELLNYKCDYIGEKYGIITGYYWYAGEPHYMFKDRSVAGKDAALFKPILHPLSDLTKEIEHNGERFVPGEVLSSLMDEYEIGYNDHYYDYEHEEYRLDDPAKQPMFIVDQLIEWHFDTQGLIEAGLAIDINTI